MVHCLGSVSAAHIGLYRELELFIAVEYFFEAPSDPEERLVIVVAPVIATANAATAAIVRLKERRAKNIRVVCLLASPQGLERLRGLHPDVPTWTAAIDEGLDDQGFILSGFPGLAAATTGVGRRRGAAGVALVISNDRAKFVFCALKISR